MAHRTRTGNERGFTLAGVIVIMTIMMIFVAYTVPRQWSVVVQRDHELQTIFVMQQYAKAINAFYLKNNKTWPVSMGQVADARQPRYLRCPKDGCLDPLTGEVDWLIIPQSQARPPSSGPPPSGVLPPTTTTAPGVPMKDYAGGPFVGIRPPKNGTSLISLNGADHYEAWMYTAFDYQAERDIRLKAAEKVWQ